MIFSNMGKIRNIRRIWIFVEDNFQAVVYEGRKHLSFYQERKRDCLDLISKYIHSSSESAVHG